MSRIRVLRLGRRCAENPPIVADVLGERVLHVAADTLGDEGRGRVAPAEVVAGCDLLDVAQIDAEVHRLEIAHIRSMRARRLELLLRRERAHRRVVMANEMAEHVNVEAVDRRRHLDAGNDLIPPSRARGRERLGKSRGPCRGRSPPGVVTPAARARSTNAVGLSRPTLALVCECRSIMNTKDVARGAVACDGCLERNQFSNHATHEETGPEGTDARRTRPVKLRPWIVISGSRVGNEGKIWVSRGRAEHVLTTYGARLGAAPRRVCVPLWRKTRDMAYLASLGHEVVGVELWRARRRAVLRRVGATPERSTRGPFEEFTRRSESRSWSGDVFDTSEGTLGPIDAAVRPRRARRAAAARRPGALRRARRRVAPEVGAILLVTFNYDT